MTFVAASYGKSFVVVFCWAWPRSSCCFCCFGDETQVWLGDLRVVLVCGFLSYFMICPFHRYHSQLRCVPLFSPLMTLSGPCHRAFTAKLEKKKKRWCSESKLKGCEVVAGTTANEPKWLQSSMHSDLLWVQEILHFILMKNGNR